MEHLQLDLEGQGGRKTVDIPFVRVPAFRFQVKLMGVLVSELDEFIFDGGAIAGAYAFDLAAIEWGEVEVILNDFSRGGGSLGKNRSG
jgi:hypothetical protein